MNINIIPWLTCSHNLSEYFLMDKYWIFYSINTWNQWIDPNTKEQRGFNSCLEAGYLN
jgi:hypothetical protein